MNLFKQNTFGKAIKLLAISSIFAFSAAHADSPSSFRIGYQKSSSLLTLLKADGLFEKQLAAKAVDVKWVEFPAGPQLLEGLNVGSIDFGYVGEAPPIFDSIYYSPSLFLLLFLLISSFFPLLFF